MNANQGQHYPKTQPAQHQQHQEQQTYIQTQYNKYSQPSLQGVYYQPLQQDSFQQYQFPDGRLRPHSWQSGEKPRFIGQTQQDPYQHRPVNWNPEQQNSGYGRHGQHDDQDDDDGKSYDGYDYK
jgi:hypothetical protein